MNLGSPKWWRLSLAALAIGSLAVAGCFLAGTQWFQRIGRAALSAAASEHGHAEAAHDDHGHGHGGEAATIKTTLWAEKIDVFLERPYAVAGEAMEPLFHVTISKSGSPVTEGSLTLVATGPKRVEVRSETPARPGIFIPSVTFPEAGVYQVSVIVQSRQVDGGGEAIELPPVVVYGSDGEALAAAKKAPAENSAEAICFLKEQQWRAKLTTAAAAPRELVERLVAPGRVVVPPGSGAIVGSPLTGKVAPPGGGFPKVGDKVEKGQVLAYVEPSVAGADAVQLVANQAQLQTLDADLAVKQLEVETRIRSAELGLERAENTLARKRKLTEEGVTAGKELLAAEHEVRLARAELDGLRQVLEPYREARRRLAGVLGGMEASGDAGDRHGSLRVSLRSPVAGTVVEATVTAGELVHTDRRLFHVVNLDTLWIEAEVSEYDLARVQKAPGASYRLAAYPDRIVPITEGGGRLVDIGAVVDPDTRTVPIRYEVSNTGGTLRVGMYADLLLATHRRQTVLAVPKEAVTDEGGEMIVYLQRGGETFERRRVVVGIRDADQVEIREGLAAGDRVATQGAYFIRLATLSKQVIGHGHTH